MHKYFQKWLDMDMTDKNPDNFLLSLRVLLDIIGSYPTTAEMQDIVAKVDATDSQLNETRLFFEKEFPETKVERKITRHEAWLLAVKSIRDFKRSRTSTGRASPVAARPAPAPLAPPSPVARPKMLVRFKTQGTKKYINGTKSVPPALKRGNGFGLVNRYTWRLLDPPRIPLERLKTALRPDYTVKVLSGFSFFNWAKKSGTALHDLRFLGAGRPRKNMNASPSTSTKSLSQKSISKVSGLASANRPPGICDGTLEDLKLWFHNIQDAHRYAVLVSTVRNMNGDVKAPANAVVSAMFCTVNGTQDAVTDVIVDFICTVQGHGVPLMRFAEDDAKERGARYIKLASVIDQVGFYQKKLGYVRSRNECDGPLKKAEIELAARAWTQSINKLEKALPKKVTSVKNAKEALGKAKTLEQIESRTKTLKKLKDVEADIRLRLSRLQQSEAWQGVKWTGRGENNKNVYEPMYKDPLYFESNSYEKKYTLPVFSKCLNPPDSARPRKAQKPKPKPKQKPKQKQQRPKGRLMAINIAFTSKPKVQARMPVG